MVQTCRCQANHVSVVYPSHTPHNSGRRPVLLASKLAQQQCRTSPSNRIVQAIAGEVSRALDAQAGSGTPADAVLGTWVGAFMATVFNDANVQKRVSVVPYMEVLT